MKVKRLLVSGGGPLKVAQPTPPRSIQCHVPAIDLFENSFWRDMETLWGFIYEAFSGNPKQ